MEIFLFSMTDHAPASCDEEGVSLEARLSSLSLPSGLVTSQNRDFWLYALKKQREMREKLEAIFQPSQEWLDDVLETATGLFYPAKTTTRGKSKKVSVVSTKRRSSSMVGNLAKRGRLSSIKSSVPEEVEEEVEEAMEQDRDENEEERDEDENEWDNLDETNPVLLPRTPARKKAKNKKKPEPEVPFITVEKDEPAPIKPPRASVRQSKRISRAVSQKEEEPPVNLRPSRASRAISKSEQIASPCQNDAGKISPKVRRSVRNGRTAAAAAKSNITKNVEELSNLGKKKRRPTEKGTRASVRSQDLEAQKEEREKQRQLLEEKLRQEEEEKRKRFAEEQRKEEEARKKKEQEEEEERKRQEEEEEKERRRKEEQERLAEEARQRQAELKRIAEEERRRKEDEEEKERLRKEKEEEERLLKEKKEREAEEQRKKEEEEEEARVKQVEQEEDEPMAVDDEYETAEDNTEEDEEDIEDKEHEEETTSTKPLPKPVINDKQPVRIRRVPKPKELTMSMSRSQEKANLRKMPFSASHLHTYSSEKKRLPATLSGSNILSSERALKTRAPLSKFLGSAEKIKKNGLISSAFSFFPSAAKEKKPTAEEIRKKKEEKIKEKELMKEEQLREKEELRKRQIEEKKAEREEKMRRAEESRKHQEEALKKKVTEKVVKAEQARLDKLAEIQKFKENQAKRLDQEQKRREALEEKRKCLEEEERQRKLQLAQEQKQEETRFKKAEPQTKPVQHHELNTTYEADKSSETENLNSTFTKGPTTTTVSEVAPPPPPPPMSSSQSATKDNPDSYDMTPARHELPPEPLENPNNYDINDLRSDDDTDDEEQPRKILPSWASGHAFRTALLTQCYNPPDVDQIFAIIDLPDLSMIFKEQRKRFFKRTSSAQWGKMPTSYKFAAS